MNQTGMEGNEAFAALSIAICWWGGLVLVGIGGLKLVVYAVGELRPGLFDSIRSETLRRFFTGRGNRMVFGLGGLITAAVGGFFMLGARGLALLLEQVRL